jgi:hypothetical protein
MAQAAACLYSLDPAMPVLLRPDGVVQVGWDPRIVRDLHNAGVPHLLVRVREATGLVGPLVIPGATSCLINH